MRPSHTVGALSLASLLVSAASAGVVEFVSSPETNSYDMAAWIAGLGAYTVNASADFESHPDGEVIPDFYPGLWIEAVNTTVDHGEGSPNGAGNRPQSPGEGPLLAYQGYTSNGTVKEGWSLAVTFDTPVVAAGFMTADLFNAFGDNNLIVEAFDGPAGTGSSLGAFVSAAYNFELNARYFMGIGDSAGRIKSIVLSTPYVSYGDSQYVDGILFAEAPATQPCPADLDGDGAVGGADLAIMLGAWGGGGAADLDGSGSVNGADLAIMLGAWGGCP